MARAATFLPRPAPQLVPRSPQSCSAGARKSFKSKTKYAGWHEKGAVIYCSFQLVEKVRFLFCASCDSTHKIEFAQQIHKNRGRGPDHPLLPLCGNSPCVPRFLYKGRKNVSGGRGFSSAFDRKRGFDREAARKTIVFRQPQRSSYILLLLAYKITPSVR